MSQLKPVIRIRLRENIRTSINGHTIERYRPDGPDTWEATLTITTTEGHITKHRFTENTKPHALIKAYKWLDKYNVQFWFNDFFKQEYAKYQHIFDENKQASSRFIDSMQKVEEGERTREEHLKLWNSRMEHYEKNKRIPAMEDHYIEIPAPPPKWSFWNWFK